MFRVADFYCFYCFATGSGCGKKRRLQSTMWYLGVRNNRDRIGGITAADVWLASDACPLPYVQVWFQATDIEGSWQMESDVSQFCQSRPHEEPKEKANSGKVASGYYRHFTLTRLHGINKIGTRSVKNISNYSTRFSKGRWARGWRWNCCKKCRIRVTCSLILKPTRMVQYQMYLRG